MESTYQTPSSPWPLNRSSPSPLTFSPLNQSSPSPSSENHHQHTLLADYFNALNLSESRLHYQDAHDSVLGRRVQSAVEGQVEGQNCNFYGDALPRGISPTYENNVNNCNLISSCQNAFSGRPETMYNRVNGPFGPDPMYVPNGLSGPKFSSGPNIDFLKNSNLYDNHFIYDNMINSPKGFMSRPGSVYSKKYGDSGSSILPMDSFGPNNLFGPDQMHVPNGLNVPFSSRPNSVQNGPMHNQNGFLDRLNTMYHQNENLDRPNTIYNKSKRVNGSFSSPGIFFEPNGVLGHDSVNVANGLSKSLLRPNKILGNQSGLGQTEPTYSGKPDNGSCLLGEDYSKYQLKEFRGNIEKMVKQREFSGFLKKKIEDGVQDDVELIFDEVKDHLGSLMVNYFGSSVVQKLFKVCRPEQISQILFSLIRIKFQFVEICCDNHGSVAMGKLLENLSTCEQRTWFISALGSVVLNLCKDQNGIKVVKYCIERFSENVDVLINKIAGDSFEIATHKSGCCIFEPCFLRSDGKMMERFMDQLGPNAAILSVHQFGNYVVQSLLNKKNPNITRNIIARLAGNYVYISMDRCGSNVVEKCLILANENEAIKIIFEIMSSDKFAMVLTDPYGNYVVQKALEVSQKMRWKEIRENLESRIMQFYASLHSHPYGNRVLSKLKNFPNRF